MPMADDEADRLARTIVTPSQYLVRSSMSVTGVIARSVGGLRGSRALVERDCGRDT
jgi:hypothetical protein